MSYSFAYNNGSSPSGTTKFAKLQIGGNNREYTTYGGLNWYASAPYDGKFLIVSDTYSQGWTTEGNATPTFWRSTENSLDSLKDLVNQLPEVNGVTGFTTVGGAINYINSSDKYLISQESDGYNEGDIITSGLVVNLDAGYSNSYPKSGTTWYNMGGTNNGTLTNGPIFNSANGGSIEFDGTNDYVEISSSGIDLGVNFTVQSWANVTRFGGAVGGNWNRGSIITNAYPYGNNQGFWICCTSQGTAAEGRRYIPGRETFFISIGQDQYNATAEIGSLTSYVGEWVNLTVSVSGTSLIKLYINGSEVTYAAQRNGPSSLSYPSLPCSLGVREDNNEEFLQGSIAGTLIYNRRLSDSEVLQNYNAQKGRFGL